MRGSLSIHHEVETGTSPFKRVCLRKPRVLPQNTSETYYTSPNQPPSCLPPRLLSQVSLISTICPATRLQQKHHASAVQRSQSPKSPPYWEHILREFVFKTISPPPPGNNHLYRRLLEAPFYGGPFPIVPNDVASVVLSRGDVYYLPNGHWLFCQEGCADCEVCTVHTYPSVKWTLRRIKRPSSHGPQRQDLQLTVIPQIDGSYHMNNLWPRSYVYVTTQGEQAVYSSDKPGHEAVGNAYANLEDSFSVQRPGSNNVWRFVERDSLAERRVPGEQSNGTVPRRLSESDSRQNIGTTVPTTTTIATTAEVLDTAKHSKRQRAREKAPDRRTANDTSNAVFSESDKERIRQLIPKLILGIDQLGQKHLVHVVPADGSTGLNFTHFALNNALNSTGLGQYQDKSGYQRVLRRIFDSLISNKRSIESFLEPIQTATVNQQMEAHQQQETRHGFTGLRKSNYLYPVYNSEIRNGLPMQQRWPLTLNWNRQRRKSNDDMNSSVFISNSTNSNRNSADSYDLYTEMQNVNINTTLSEGSKNGSVADRFNFKSIDRNYYNGNAFSGDTGTSNARSDQQHEFGARKFKIVVTTESTAKPLVVTNENDWLHKFVIDGINLDTGLEEVFNEEETY
ncbi:uncharacterized protein LOC143177302 [Calliopsis andreniformis]|uniref:uncharacterized protein LOC143177302 n=1 Tax=Calliopsis andreniformis TaxID=337506 RepID=UPI003FCC3D04